MRKTTIKPCEPGGFIKLRQKHNAKLHAKLMVLLRTLDPDTLNFVVRAYNLYFSLVNIAEEDYMHQQRRKQVRLGLRLWRGHQPGKERFLYRYFL